MTPQVISNIFSASLLIIIAINENKQFNRHLPQERLFMALVYTNIALCFSAISYWYCQSQSGKFYVILNFLFISATFITIPVLVYNWFLYSLFSIFRDFPLIQKYKKYTKLIIVVVIAFLIINFFTLFLFYLDENNGFHRGSLFYHFMIACLLFFLFTNAMIVYNRKKIRQGHLVPLLFFAVPTIISCVISVLAYGIEINWAGTTLAIFIIYLFIQKQRLGTDYLTNLYNRRELNEYLENHIRGRRSNERFGIIMIDINQFKSINDRWGHIVGDEVLVAHSKILKSSFRAGEFIARYGGDEFIVVMKADSIDEVTAAVNRFIKSINQFNSMNNKPWELSVSIGYDIYDPATHDLNVDELLNHVDKLMYKAKSESGTTAITKEIKA